METDKRALSLSHRDVGHRDVGHSERGEDDWVLVRVGGVGGGDKFMLGWLRVSQERSGLSQEDVLRSWCGQVNLFAEDWAANHSYALWEPMIWRKEKRDFGKRGRRGSIQRDRGAEGLEHGHSLYEQKTNSSLSIGKLLNGAFCFHQDISLTFLPRGSIHNNKSYTLNKKPK